MMIYTHDKKRVINLNKYNGLRLDNVFPGVINAIAGYAAPGAIEIQLADYKTEERAKEVLEEIVRAESYKKRIYIMPEE